MIGRRKIAVLGLLATIVLVAAGLIALTYLHGPVADRQPGKLRIVSLAPSVTEMVFFMGAGDELVGATQYCDWPPQARNIERVGGLGDASVEKVLSLSPDMVIATDFRVKDDAQALRRAGVRVLQVRINGFEEMFSAMMRIGQAIGRIDEAERTVADMRADLDAASAAYGNLPRAARPKVFVEIWNDPLTTAGRDSFLTDLIWRAGGVNVAGDLPKAHLAISPEKVIEWNPDVIILSYMGRQNERIAEVRERIGWSDIDAVKNGRIIVDIPAEYILRPGPRLIEGIKQLSRRLHQATEAGGGPSQLDTRMPATRDRKGAVERPLASTRGSLETTKTTSQP